MDYGGSPPGYQARLARVEEQLAELQAEVAELKRIQSQSGHAQDNQPGEDTFHDCVAASSLAAPGDGLAAQSARLEVRLTIFVAAPQLDPHPAQDGLQGNPLDTGAETQVNPIVVVHAPQELRELVREQPGPLREHVESLLEDVQERLSQIAAGSLVDTVWEPASAAWHVTDFGGFDSLSGLSGAVDNWGHREVGNFVEQLGHLVGLPNIAANGAGVVASYMVPLPVDQPLEELSRLIQIAGAIAFAASGGHVLACASLKSLAHDELVNQFASALSSVIWPNTAAAADHFSFCDLEELPTVSALTLEACTSGIDRESIEPDNYISPARHLPNDEYQDNTPEIRT